MGRFPGGGRGGGAAILERMVQTPWIAYIFLFLLVYFLLSAFIEQKKVFGYVQVTIAICIPVMILFKDAQGYGWQYWMIWAAGLIGCLVYWLKWMIEKTPANIN